MAIGGWLEVIKRHGCAMVKGFRLSLLVFRERMGGFVPLHDALIVLFDDLVRRVIVKPSEVAFQLLEDILREVTAFLDACHTAFGQFKIG